MKTLIRQLRGEHAVRRHIVKENTIVSKSAEAGFI